VPDVTTGGLDTVGVRLPSSEVARALIRESGCPIAAPSANISGRPSPTTAEHVIHDLYGRIDGIICGDDCDFGIESSVIDMTCETPMILRPGAITQEMFSEALGREVAVDQSLFKRPQNILDPEKVKDMGTLEDEDFHPRSPGMKYKHYAPCAEMIVFDGEIGSVRKAMDAEAKELEKQGKSVFKLSFTDEKLAAHELFAKLREADELGVDVILAEALPEQGLGFSVMNRMLKSAGYNVRRII
ncbi:MAG: L-threonylcarbamoyladenylate synthase, partial [[Eubacterium] sulci]|nr:L-threonylcarbamoyladenylate synthase [[Eubacterium] sulci]